MNDDYILAILPLASLIAENPGIDQCYALTCDDLRDYHKVLRSGVLGYKLYTYHKLVRIRFGPRIERQVRTHHLDILSEICEFSPVLDIIDDAVHIGTITTSTSLGEVVTSVEMTVALALLLGLPESLHYATSPGQQAAQIAQMPAEIDSCFADLLAHGRREMVRTFEGLVELLGIPESSAPGNTRSNTGN